MENIQEFTKLSGSGNFGVAIMILLVVALALILYRGYLKARTKKQPD